MPGSITSDIVGGRGAPPSTREFGGSDGDAGGRGASRRASITGLFVLLAAIFSILILLKRASRPRIASLGRVPATDRFVDASRYPEGEAVPHVVVLRVESGLFYFNAENVKDEVLLRVRQGERVKLVVIDLSTSPNIDLAGVRMLGQLHDQLKQAGVFLGLAEVHGSLRDLAQAEGLHTRIPGADQRLGVAALIQRCEDAATQIRTYA